MATDYYASHYTSLCFRGRSSWLSSNTASSGSSTGKFRAASVTYGSQSGRCGAWAEGSTGNKVSMTVSCRECGTASGRTRFEGEVSQERTNGSRASALRRAIRIAVFETPAVVSDEEIYLRILRRGSFDFPDYGSAAPAIDEELEVHDGPGRVPPGRIRQREVDGNASESHSPPALADLLNKLKLVPTFLPKAGSG